MSGIKVGDKIRITHVSAKTTMAPDGIDHQAKAMEGKEGTVEYIDSMGQIFGTWGGLAILPEEDRFEVL